MSFYIRNKLKLTIQSCAFAWKHQNVGIFKTVEGVISSKDVFQSRGGEHLLKDCPIEFYKIYDHIRRLGYMDRPNYMLIRRTITEICERRNFSIEDPFDWEEGGRYHKEYLRTIEQLENENQHNLGKRTEATARKQEELETVYSSADLSCEHSDVPTARDLVSGRSKEHRSSMDLSSIYRLLHRYPYNPASQKCSPHE
uniref:Protein kinase domain-containing protein n=1 Tax=Parascaris univalens TaxID=6257 RepID=A0A914ZZ17_PARUN